MVEYEGLHGLCTACGIYGHHDDHCSMGGKIKNMGGDQDTNVERNINSSNIPVEEINSGQEVWRVVQKPRRRKNETKRKEAVDPKLASGSRYEVLFGERERDETSERGKQVKDLGNMGVVIRSEDADLRDSLRNDGYGVACS
ncbi:hypothetical protein K1719_017621 [Acacia pycnantha]|nr:hypothetical protein K1719_017621 [Acacia pycnantha]